MTHRKALIGVASVVLFSFPTLAQIAGVLPSQPQTDTQSENAQQHVITISRGGEAYAKPDLGILVMSIRSTSAIADEAVSQNAQKAKAVEDGLAQIGISSSGYKITSVVFGTGNPQFGPIPQQGITAYDAVQSVYVFFRRRGS